MDSNFESNLGISEMLDKIMQDEERKSKKKKTTSEKQSTKQFNFNQQTNNMAPSMVPIPYSHHERSNFSNYTNPNGFHLEQISARPANLNIMPHSQIPNLSVPPPVMHSAPPITSFPGVSSEMPHLHGVPVNNMSVNLTTPPPPYMGSRNPEHYYTNYNAAFSQGRPNQNPNISMPQQYVENNTNIPFPVPPNPNSTFLNSPNVYGTADKSKERGEIVLPSKIEKKKKKKKVNSSGEVSIAKLLPPPPSPPKLKNLSHAIPAGPCTPPRPFSPPHYSNMSFPYITENNNPATEAKLPPLNNLMKSLKSQESSLKSIKIKGYSGSHSAKSVKSSSKNERKRKLSDISSSLNDYEEEKVKIKLDMDVRDKSADTGVHPKGIINENLYLSREVNESQVYNEGHNPLNSQFGPMPMNNNIREHHPFSPSGMRFPQQYGERPPFNNRGRPRFNHYGGGPRFKMGDRPPMFPPMEGSPFPPPGPRFPFSPMNGPPPPFNSFGDRPPFRPNFMREGPPFNPMDDGLPFNPICEGPPFNPMVEGPPFHPMGAGPPFNPMVEGPPFHPIGVGPPFIPMEEGSPYKSKDKGSSFNNKVEDFHEFEEEYPYEHEWSPESDYKHKSVKHHKKTKKVKKKLHKDYKEKETYDIEYEKKKKSLTKVKSTNTKHENKEKILKTRKKLVDYELEPGEITSDSDDESSSTVESSSSSNASSDKEQETIEKNYKSFSSDSDDSSLDLDFLKKKKYKTVTKYDRYSDDNDDGYCDGDHNYDSENYCDSTKSSEKPKFPRYFKDRVAYSDDTSNIFKEDKVSSPVAEKDTFSTKSKDEIKKPLSPPISSESLKAIKTPLIKRLGLVECNSNPKEERVEFKSDFSESSKSKEPDEVKLDVDKVEPYSSTMFSNKDDLKNIKSSYSPYDFDEFRQRSNSVSPNSSLDYEEYKLLASTKELLSASKSIFKSPNSPKTTTTKKQYEKPIIKIETVSKPSPQKYIKESPQRIDLDSRIKLMFGMKSSGEDDSPEKKNFRNAAFSYKNMRILSRPPSPFRSKNAYQFWHRETYYFRKNNPIPDVFADPTQKRKIGIQIKELNEDLLYNNNNIEVNKLDIDSKTMANQLEIKHKSETCDGDNSDKSNKYASSSCSEIHSNLISTLVPDLQTSTITKVDIQPNIEVELISGGSQCDVKKNISHGVSNCLGINKTEGFNSEHILKLILSKLVEELKNDIKDKLTEEILNEKVPVSDQVNSKEDKLLEDLNKENLLENTTEKNETIEHSSSSSSSSKEQDGCLPQEFKTESINESMIKSEETEHSLHMNHKHEVNDKCDKISEIKHLSNVFSNENLTENLIVEHKIRETEEHKAELEQYEKINQEHTLKDMDEAVSKLDFISDEQNVQFAQNMCNKHGIETLLDSKCENENFNIQKDQLKENVHVIEVDSENKIIAESEDKIIVDNEYTNNDTSPSNNELEIEKLTKS